MTRDPWEPGDGGPVEIPLDGELDLHAFHPREVCSVVEEYLEACRGAGILRVRLIHGKGIGALRETVHALLRRRSDVRAFRLDTEGPSGWGATLVDLEPPPGPRPRSP